MLQEKQKATELAIEEMSERVEALEAENRQLQKILEDATHSVKVRHSKKQSQIVHPVHFRGLRPQLMTGHCCCVP